MKAQRPLKFAALGLVALAGIVLAAAFILPVSTGANTVNVGYSATVTVVATHPDGTEFYRHTSHNLLVDEGKEFIEDQVISAAPGSNGANYIALSNDGSAP